MFACMVSLPSADMLTKLSPSFVHVFPCEHSLLKYDPWLIPAFTDDSSVVDMVNRLSPSLMHRAYTFKFVFIFCYLFRFTVYP